MKETEFPSPADEAPDDVPVTIEPGEEEIVAPKCRGGLLAPLQIPIFRALWIAAAVGNIGGQMRDSGAGWLMTSLSDSPVMVGMVSTLATAPGLFLMPLAGALVDTCDRRKLLIATQSLLCLLAAALAFFTFFDWISPRSLLAFVTAIGVVGVFNMNCWQVVVHDVVPRPLLSSAVSLNSASFNGARSIGPALGGVIIAMGGSGAAFALNAFSVLGTIFVLFRWKERPVTVRAQSGSIFKALREGFEYLVSRRLVALLLVRNMIFIAAGMSVLALLPLLVRMHLGLGPREFGILGGCFGGGAMSAALATHALTERFGIRLVTRAGLLLSITTLFGVGLATVFYSPVVIFGILILLNGFSWTTVALNHNVRVRMSVPSEYSGRVFSYYAISGTGGMALGSLMAGWLASLIGLSGAYFCAAGLSLVAFLLAIRHPMPEVHRE